MNQEQPIAPVVNDYDLLVDSKIPASFMTDMCNLMESEPFPIFDAASFAVTQEVIDTETFDCYRQLSDYDLPRSFFRLRTLLYLLAKVLVTNPNRMTANDYDYQCQNIEEHFAIFERNLNTCTYDFSPLNREDVFQNIVNHYQSILDLYDPERNIYKYDRIFINGL